MLDPKIKGQRLPGLTTLEHIDAADLLKQLMGRLPSYRVTHCRKSIEWAEKMLDAKIDEVLYRVNIDA
jgi:hypothetical protein